VRRRGYLSNCKGRSSLNAEQPKKKGDEKRSPGWVGKYGKLCTRRGLPSDLLLPRKLSSSTLCKGGVPDGSVGRKGGVLILC